MLTYIQWSSDLNVRIVEPRQIACFFVPPKVMRWDAVL